MFECTYNQQKKGGESVETWARQSKEFEIKFFIIENVTVIFKLPSQATI